MTTTNNALPLGSSLADHQSVWAEALRAVATTWRVRAEAGRLGDSSPAEVLYLAALFEDAARLVQGQPASSKDTGHPHRVAPSSRPSSSG